MTCINAKAKPINDTNYNCHTTAIELFKPIIWVNTISLVTNSLGGRHTHAYRHPHKNNFKKPGVRRPQVSTPGLITQSHLPIGQASSSLKHLDMRHATPTFKTEVFRLAGAA